jgi:hypothetical protein
LAGNTPILPLETKAILNYDKAIWNYNGSLFEFESLNALKAELAGYFNCL